MNTKKGVVKKTKERVSVSLSDEVTNRLRTIGEQYGLGLSNMLERAARLYLEDIDDNAIAHHRYLNERGDAISLEQVKKELGLDH